MLALRIAWRYLCARKSHNAVNVITVISVAGVAVASMAMVVVLSIFNGFSDIASSHLALIDPGLKIERTDGRMLADADSIARLAGRHGGVRGAIVSVESRGLLVGTGNQTPVVFRGVPEEYARLSGIRRSIIDGDYAVGTTGGDSVSAAVVSVGVANAMLAGVDASRRLKLYVPRRVGRINPANPAAAFRMSPVAVSGVFSIGQGEYDGDYIFVPLDLARDILEYDSGAGDAVELFLAEDCDLGQLKRELAAELGPEYKLSDGIEQHSEAFRMISIEKWITFMMLVFILVVALFNIVSTLSLLVIEKRDNMATLRAMGAGDSLISKVFVTEGWLVTLSGGIAGIVLGIVLTLVQEHFGIIRLAGNSAMLAVEAYPVRLSVGDILLTLLAVAVTGLLASQTTRLFLRRGRSS